MSGSVCQYGHPFDGRYCQRCKDAKREAKRVANHEVVRKKACGEPDILVVDDDWREDAACRYPPHGVDADDWFALWITLDDRARVERVKAVCDDCPVRAQCLDYALDTRQPYGIWGGLTTHERGTAYHP